MTFGVKIVQRAENNIPSINTYLPPYRCERRPPGICVTKYPQKNDDKIMPCCSCDHAKTSLF